MAEEIRAWKPPSDNVRYRFAKAALLHEESECIAIVKDLQRRASLELREIAKWPLAERMKNESSLFSRQLTLALNGQQQTQFPSSFPFRAKKNKIQRGKERKKRK